MNSIKLIRGDDASLNITFKNQAGEVINLTGYSVRFTVKREKDLAVDDDTQAVISKNITEIPNPTLGVLTLTLTNTETDLPIGAYVWDLQLKSSTGVISSTQKGSLEVINDVSKSA